MLPVGFSNTNVGMPAVRLTEVERLYYEHCRSGHKALSDVLDACKLRGVTFSKEAVRAVALMCSLRPFGREHDGEGSGAA